MLEQVFSETTLILMLLAYIGGMITTLVLLAPRSRLN